MHNFFSRTWSVGAQTFLSMLVVSSLLALLVAITLAQVMKEDELGQLQEDLEKKTEQFSSTLMDPLLSEDIPVLEGALLGLSEIYPNLTGAHICDYKNKSLLQWGSDIPSCISSDQMYIWSNNNRITSYREVTFAGEYFGSVTLRWDLSSRYAKLTQQINRIVVVLVISVLIFSLLLFWLIHKMVVVPIGKLDQHLWNVESSELPTEDSSFHSKEFNHLSDGIKALLESKSAEAKLRDKLIQHGKVLEKSIEREQRANQAKDEFLASMSHELRTPLTTIIGNSEILSDSRLNQDQQHLLHSIEVSSQNLLSLVNDVLDLSKMGAGKFEIDNAPFDLGDLLGNVREIFNTRTRDAGLNFEVKQKTFPKYQIWGDGKRIGQILINLLGNAVKFTEQGSVTLTVWAGNELNFLVEDTGIGMSAEVIERLFSPFEQADSSISRRFGGTGLGLHISLSLAEVMGGSIEVSSEKGAGSKFLLKLPYHESELSIKKQSEKNKGSAAESALTARFTGKVLIAEDTLELQLLECRILESMGVTVTVVSNGEEVIEKIAEQDFDLIFMDMQMPVMDGLEATRVLRQQGIQTPVVALTANVMQKHREIFCEAGANGFLQKPINRAEIQQTLKEYLKQDDGLQINIQQPVSGQMAEEEVEDSSDFSMGSSIGVVENTHRYDSPPYPLLIIDDEHSILDLYEMVLTGDDSVEQQLNDIFNIAKKEQLESSEKEFVLSLADQGQSGVEMAQLALSEGTPFPVAFIDIRMPPGMNGLETAKALRKLDERIYIVIVSGYSDIDPEEINQELEYGMLYLQKPFSSQEIKQIARMLVQVWNKDRSLAQQRLGATVEQGEELANGQEEPSINSDHEVLQQLFAAPASAEDEVDDELMVIFRDSTAKNRERLTAAFSRKDWAEVRAVVHTIKGSAISFGYPELSKVAEDLQYAIDEEQQDKAPELVMDLLIEVGKVLS